MTLEPPPTTARQCPKCLEVKPITAFSKNGSGGRRRKICASCSSKRVLDCITCGKRLSPPRAGMRFCSRACILVTVGLPAEFDPSSQYGRVFAPEAMDVRRPTAKQKRLQAQIKAMFDDLQQAVPR
jgi:hypothetical protein